VASCARIAATSSGVGLMSKGWKEAVLAMEAIGLVGDGKL